VELKVVALDVPGLLQRGDVRFLREGDMDRGGLRLPAQGLESADQGGAGLICARSVRDQQARARRRGEGRGDLELRVVAPAGALIGIGPAMVEDIFALAVALQEAGCCGQELTGIVLDEEIGRRPAGAAAGAAALLQRHEEFMADEGIVPVERGIAGARGGGRDGVRQRMRVGAGIPCACGDGLEGGRDTNGEIAALRFAQGRKPSKTIWSAMAAARCRSSGVRTVQLIKGRPSALRQR